MLQISQSGRYEQHPLVHQYAEEKLAQWPHEQQRCMEQHGRFYADFLRQRGKRLKGTGQKQASAEIVEEIENVRVAWQWMVTRQRWFEIAKCLESLAYFYLTRSWYQEGATKMGQAVAAMGEARGAFSNPIKAIVRGSALVAQAMFCVYQGQFEQAKNLSANGLHLLRPIGIRRLIALALGWLGLAELNLGQHELAATHLREGLTLATAAKERWLVGVLLTFAGHVAQAKDLAEAIGYYRNSVAAFESIGDQRTVATPLYFLGATLYYSGNLAEAKRCLQECLASARETGVRQQAAWSLASLGDIALNSGDFAEAQHRYQESLALSEEIGDSGLTVVNQAALGIVAGMSGDDAAAKDAFRKACKKTIDMRAWPQLVGLVVRWATFLATQGKIEQKYVVEWVAQALHQPFIKQGDKLLAERLLDRLRATVPPDVLATAQGRGQARPLEEIVNEIMQHETTIGESSCYSEGWMADPAMKKHAAFEI
jgi:tetratricopeptide (TPR) repeat protein